jgi:hypothetical protein
MTWRAFFNNINAWQSKKQTRVVLFAAETARSKPGQLGTERWTPPMMAHRKMPTVRFVFCQEEGRKNAVCTAIADDDGGPFLCPLSR